MTVAWIGDRGVPVAEAAKHAAELLVSSLCPVFSLNTDVHGTRAAIALASRVGAAYDQVDGEAVARETALFTDKGGMFIAPGETRRRADVVVIAGELPAIYHELVLELANTVPDLDSKGVNARQFFLLGEGTPAPGKLKATRLACEGGLGGTLAALRAQMAGRATTRQVTNFDRFAKALAEARFPVFTFCGQSLETLELEMLQGMISDINRKSRASALHLPASENGWGSTQASTWTTGFALRTGLARGFAEFDPWRFNVARMIADGEADMHLVVAAVAGSVPAARKGTGMIVLSNTGKPAKGAAVTIAIGTPGVDHAAVVYSSRIGTLAAVEATAATELPTAAAILREIAGHLPHEEALPC